MKLHWHSILPFCIVLGSGMAVGSLHNAMSRDTIDAPFGYLLIAYVFVGLVAGLILARYYEGLSAPGYGGALGWAGFVAFGGIANILSTEDLSTFLFHEYLLPIVGVLQVGKLLTEKLAGSSAEPAS